jgi:hypothetical protein
MAMPVPDWAIAEPDTQSAPDWAQSSTPAPTSSVPGWAQETTSITAQSNGATGQPWYQRALDAAKAPSPEWLQKPEQAVRGYIKGMIPGSVEEAMRSANIPTNWRDPEQLAELAVPMLKTSVDTARQAMSRAGQIKAAEETPAGSQERWNAGIGTVLDLANMAAFLKGSAGPRPKAFEAKPEVPAPSKPVLTELKPETARVEGAPEAESVPQGPVKAPGGPAIASEAPPTLNIGDFIGDKPGVDEGMAVAPDEGQLQGQDASPHKVESAVRPVGAPEEVAAPQKGGKAGSPAGTSNRLFEETYGKDVVPGGKGVDTTELLDNARASIRSGGADPYSILSKTRAKGIASPEEYAALAAEHERLVNDAVAKEKANDPTAPEAAKQAEDFANAIQPHKTAASDLMRLFQGDLNYDVSTVFGMDQYMKSEIGRSMKPSEVPRFKRMSDGIRQAETGVQEAISRSDSRVKSRYAKVRDITIKEAAERVRKMLGDCVV